TPLHHRRLRETLDWSFELCSPAERTLWSRLAVFRGTFDLDAVVAVCASDDLPRDAVVESLGGLIDKSIALREDTAGQARYRLLETVREYGLSRLSPGDGPDTAPRRHRDPVLEAAATFEAGTATLWRGEDLDRAETLLEDALSRFVAVADPLGQVMTQTTLAYPPLFRGDPQRAEALCTEARETCRRHGDRWWLAYNLQASGIIAFSAAAVDDGRRYAEEAIVLHHQLGDNRGVASALDRLAYAATAGGELERAACLMGANF